MAQSPSARRWYHPLSLLKRFVIYLLVFVVVLYVCVGVFLYTQETNLTYYAYMYPVARDEALKQANAAGLVPWEHTTAGAEGPQGFVASDFEKQAAPRGTVVFFHGNGEAAYQWASQIPAFTQRGLRVFLYEYPGYGSRPGIPSEKSIVPDAQAVVRELAKEGLGPIYVWGQSIGSGVAAAVCADGTLPIQGLTLVTPWDTIGNVGQTYYPWLPVKLVMRDKYDSVANLQKFGKPVCIIWGDKDDTIPPACTRNLIAKLPKPKKVILFSGHGHGDWSYQAKESWWDDAIDFIAPKK